jgi:hypothetical protein
MAPADRWTTQTLLDHPDAGVGRRVSRYLGRDMADDPYDVLGVEPATDITQIRRAYLAQLRRSHPDLFPGDAAAEERTRQLNRAWAEVTVRHGRVAPAGTRTRPSRQAQQAYSSDQRAFRTAFTTATLRVVLVVLAVGLALLAVQVG